jgi:hypothetical protein
VGPAERQIDTSSGPSLYLPVIAVGK